MTTSLRPSRRTFRILAAVTAFTVATFVPDAGAEGPTAPPVGSQSFGPIADWGEVTGTDGRVYIADSKGRALQFHGFNDKTDDPEASLTDDLLSAAAARGLDHYRMSIYWQYLEPTEGNYDEAYLDKIVTAIRRAERHGIRVILDMHQDVYGEAFGSTGAPAWATETDGLPYVPQPSWLLDYLQPGVQRAFENLYEKPRLRQAQIDVWMHVVNRVKDEPGVLGYDLMNEPFGEMKPGEDLITAAARVESEQMTPMYQRLTDAIRTVDTDHWVFIEPPNLASLGIPTSLGKVNGSRIALYPHMYDTSLEGSTYDPDSTEYTYDPEFFDKWANAITTYTDKYPIPMLVGEWGVAKPTAHSMDEFVRKSLSTLDRVTSGWSQFVFCFGSGYCALDEAGNDRPNISQIFQPYARAIAGAPTASTYDFTSKELRVAYRDNAAQGPTEIFIPESRSYPDGFRVLTSDAGTGVSHDFDASTGVLSVNLPETSGDHAICVVPSDSSATACPVSKEVDEPAPPAEQTPPVQGGGAPVAEAVRAQPTFTG